ncbi:family 4 glycosyl hydrolase [[Clostridium] sordellii]|uniref:Glycosyl hydrolase, family 4 n=1 Tax=Paraclostridium sordellii TaxID=1505 RepID=A0ABM9RLX5_PARSO|nr:alpha-glucosidase/alpha-galactosidase [Paeniclostridium sordellii]CEJ73022.1 glycosyl hydrolase, family 4 [[Clostridium] sordellii] [Paeniclostridium sordellii]CEN68575.1 family 4 glycosyl hydrolase [[Clostridium] sordellii] [Paeniclostridium sordellii]CEN71842.1 family 4 glycosyl hydrolase [[Clostridium] sordellii] [Paeniclostridium sordellii]CEO22483.1 family 4 glycosyl hydrolase [[Clostridium] sordellii] [Paeniclostridium sordellii]CEP76565.1 family 4 glycosyl hydrolase [[Clostridium] so
MGKITFLGVGSAIFAKNVLGDCMLTEALRDFEIALYDIDEKRLDESYNMLSIINKTLNKSRANINKYKDRKEALRGAKYIVNAIQVGGYDPCTITDFEVPKKYGLRQTIGDTLGIGGIFRGLRTIPVMLDFAKDIEEVCPDALLLNYTNPMSMITLAMIKGTKVKTVGLCHSVQTCASDLLSKLNMSTEGISYKIAGINHMGWLLEITKDGKDLYPEIKERANALGKHDDMIRFELMKQFGYYVTESSEHNAEYLPYFIKNTHPELIEKYNIPLDEYPRRCISQIENWDKRKKDLVNNEKINHKRTKEYASYIMEAIETGRPYTFGGNVLNTGLITNLPNDCCVEVTCLADKNGITPCYVGELPIQLAALNRTNVNVQLLTVEAALTRNKDYIYYAAMLDPHTSSELSIDEIKNLVDDLIKEHGDWLPKFK